MRGSTAPLSLLALAGLGSSLAAGAFANRAWLSLVGHSPAPLSLPAGESTPALTPRVVLVLADGLGQNDSIRVPVLERLGPRGACLVCQVAPPSYSRPGRATLATGARPHLHGATTNFHEDRPAVAPSLFDSLPDARVRGSILWGELFPGALSPERRASPPFSLDQGAFPRLSEALFVWEREAAEAVLSESSRFEVLDLLGGDWSSHEHALASLEHARALQHADQVISKLASTLDLTTTTLVITADHGHVSEGGHGGVEPEVTTVPLLLLGRAVKVGATGTCVHPDVAPTLAALLGVPVPEMAEGRTLTEALDLDEAARTALAERDARRLLALSSALPRPRGLPARLPAVLAGAGLSLALLILGRRATGDRGLALGTLVGLAVILALVRATSMRLSLSGINEETDLEPYFLKLSLLALVAFSAAALAAAIASRGAAAARARAGLGGVLGLLALLLSFATWAHAAHGLILDGPVDDLAVLFRAFCALVAIVASAPVVALLAVVGVLGSRSASAP